ncbi:MAG: hypothetical protein D3912_07835 [Candidatus Electrothrix sp. AX1]|nr:hypothetical protein [Candidatus Electrothrix sp. AX1]
MALGVLFNTMKNFTFESNDIFVLVGRGVVFRGHVLNSEANTGEKVYFDSEGGRISECDRKIIDSTISDKEIGLLLTNFNPSKFNKIININPSHEEMKKLPSPVEMLETKYPVTLIGIEWDQ